MYISTALYAAFIVFPIATY